MCKTMARIVLLIFVSSLFSLVSSLQIIKSDCEILNSQGKVVKEEYEQNTKNLIRICEGLVKIKKCEGKCSSSLQPSFNSPNGFQKVTSNFILKSYLFFLIHFY